MHVTLTSVCERTGYSTATVSRVMNGSPLVRETTRKRVLKAIEELGYQPSHAARMLKKQRTEMIAVVFPDIDSGFFTEVLRGIDERAAESGYHIMTAFSHGQRDEQKLVTQFIKERRADGLILMNLSLPATFVKKIASWGLPIVLIDRPVGGSQLTAVCIDNERGAEQAAEHLLSLGYRRIGLLTGPKDSYDAQQRQKGFLRALRKAKVNLPDEMVGRGAFTEESGYRVMTSWIRSAIPLPEAMFAANDAMAVGVLAALREHGLDAPKDMALMGFDDTELARHLGLTTIHVPMRDLGRTAVRASIGQISHEHSEGIHVMPTHLMIRTSCGSKHPRGRTGGNGVE